MPGEQYVFLPVPAGVTDQRKGQAVFVGSTKFVNAGACAAFRGFGSGALNCHGVSSDRVGAPDIAFAVVIPVDFKRSVGLHRPDGAE